MNFTDLSTFKGKQLNPKLEAKKVELTFRVLVQRL